MEILHETEIDIKRLYESPEGSEEVFEFEIELPELTDDFALDSALTGKLRLIKEKHGILVLLQELDFVIQAQCDLCLEDAKLKPKVRDKDREYLSKKGYDERLGELDDQNLFRIDMSRMIIDLTEFLREEVLLAKPELIQCQKNCKGLCPECGQNLNLSSCECPKDVKNKQNPFQNLKDMLKEQ